ncbi:glycosyltransferase, partial [Candidatus Uhrbacteria bacterium]|nr:glycosyltransferase [Candidatus Uhrbacteria bacterium]
MKIAMLGQKGIPAVFGGIERHVEELATRLAARGHEVLVYCRPWYSKNTAFKTPNSVRCIALRTIKTKHLDAIAHTLFGTLHAILFMNP